VVVVSDRESEERLSQVAAVQAGELSNVTNIGAKITPTSFMSPLFRSFGRQRQDEGDSYKRGLKEDRMAPDSP
jgi:hypothetical protein